MDQTTTLKYTMTAELARSVGLLICHGYPTLIF